MAGFGIDRSSVASGSGASASSIPEAIIDAKGDLIAGASADTPVRVAVGTNEERLVADSTQAGGLIWKPDTTNYAVAAKGDLLAGTAADTLAALTVGAAGEVLLPASGTASGLAWLRHKPAGAYLINGKIARTVGASALTLAVKTLADADPTTSSPVYVLMPTATSNVLDGGYVVRSITAALSTAVSSGSTLGHSNATAAPVFVYLLDNAGTIEIAESAKFFGGASVQTTTAEGGAGAADSRTVLYSTTLRSNVVVACIQSWESTQTTAGTWAATTGQVLPYPFQATAVGTDGQVVAADSTRVSGSVYIDNPSRPNLLINPNWQIDQINEGALYTADASEQGPDGWTAALVGAGVFKLRTLADPDNAALQCLEITCTTADASIAATDVYKIYTAVEGYDAAALMFGTSSAGTVTLQFKFKTSVTGTYAFALSNSAGNRTNPQVITVADTNENAYSLTWTADTTGTWLYTNVVGVYLTMTLAAGTDFNGASNTWAADAKHSIAGTVNFMSANTNIAYLKRIQLIPGSVVQAYKPADIQKELAKCQRYYAKIKAFGNHVHLVATTTSDIFWSEKFPVTMRAVPTYTNVLTNMNIGNFSNSYQASGGANNAQVLSAEGVGIRGNGFTGIDATRTDLYISDTQGTVIATVNARLS